LPGGTEKYQGSWCTRRDTRLAPAKHKSETPCQTVCYIVNDNMIKLIDVYFFIDQLLKE
jgi:hypothetical protein